MKSRLGAVEKFTILVNERPARIDDAEARIGVEKRNLPGQFVGVPTIVGIDEGNQRACGGINPGVLGLRLPDMVEPHEIGRAHV